MQHVFVKCSYDVLQMPVFFKKLKEFIGEFRFEQQSVEDIETGIVTISFYTDKVTIEEGKRKQVDIIAETSEDFLIVNGHKVHDWHFTKIEAI